jgi:hypothetical protein
VTVPKVTVTGLLSRDILEELAWEMTRWDKNTLPDMTRDQKGRLENGEVFHRRVGQYWLDPVRRTTSSWIVVEGPMTWEDYKYENPSPAGQW